MTFKAAWEKTNQLHELSEFIIRGMVLRAFPQHRLKHYEVISGGCANLNVHLKLATLKEDFILRVYLREPSSAYREQRLGEFLQHHLPLPQTYYVGDFADYRFAITQFLTGISLRELLLGNELFDVGEIMFAAGQYLGKIQKHRFSSSGFFDNELNIAHIISQKDYVEFSKDCLQQLAAMKSLNPETIHTIHSLVERFSYCFPTEKDDHLVHADFDPANILVKKQGKYWKISGILDWEFAYSGSPLNDIANMLRYAHHMPEVFTTSFLDGLKENYTLPEDWRLRTHMMNLLALLDCLALSPITEKPRRYADICSVIDHIIHQLLQT